LEELDAIGPNLIISRGKKKPDGENHDSSVKNKKKYCLAYHY
jgi:hypothetical protein